MISERWSDALNQWVPDDRSDVSLAVTAMFNAERQLGCARVAVAKAFGPARRAAGLTQAQVAAEAGVSVVYVSDIERGKRDPAMRVCEALLRLLGES